MLPRRYGTEKTSLKPRNGEKAFSLSFCGRLPDACGSAEGVLQAEVGLADNVIFEEIFAGSFSNDLSGRKDIVAGGHLEH